VLNGCAGAPALDSSPSTLALQPLFPLALGQVQLRPDPLDLALQIQALHELRGDACSNPDPDCAWTGDLNGVWRLHEHPTFAPLIEELSGHAHRYLAQLGFEPARVALHIQRCWPVLSEPGQVVGRHHHPNAHLSAVYYFNGDGSGHSGCLRFFPHSQPNELVPGLAVGHGGPIASPDPWNQPWVDVAPRAGLLLLFPSRLDHAVLPNDDPDDVRCSLSIDFALSAPFSSVVDAPPEYLAPHPSQWSAVSAR
jgi:uncharacterized protein (TIGR02466 family)